MPRLRPEAAREMGETSRSAPQCAKPSSCITSSCGRSSSPRRHSTERCSSRRFVALAGPGHDRCRGRQAFGDTDPRQPAVLGPGTGARPASRNGMRWRWRGRRSRPSISTASRCSFRPAVRAWAEQLERTERLAVMAERLSELDGVDPSPPDEPAAFEARVEQLVADHVEPARVKALDELGEGRRAMSITMRWLEPKLG